MKQQDISQDTPIPLDSIFFQDISFVHLFQASLYGVLWTADACLGHSLLQVALLFPIRLTDNGNPFFNTKQMAILSPSSQ